MASGALPAEDTRELLKHTLRGKESQHRFIPTLSVSEVLHIYFQHLWYFFSWFYYQTSHHSVPKYLRIYLITDKKIWKHSSYQFITNTIYIQPLKSPKFYSPQICHFFHFYLLLFFFVKQNKMNKKENTLPV